VSGDFHQAIINHGSPVAMTLHLIAQLYDLVNNHFECPLFPSDDTSR
jgi:hypothetical protein